MEAALSHMRATIAQRELAGPDTPVLAMISGGSDSTALAYLVKHLQDEGEIGPAALLHVNHKLRGDESDADAEFVATLAEALDLPLYMVEVDVELLSEQTGENLEAIGRRERYAAAQEALKSLCLHTASPTSKGRIFTAHTQDDRVESFYMRSIVGTGPGGFRSMLYRNGPVVRPLLDLSREALRTMITARATTADPDRPVVADPTGALWREDATNAHTDRFRAFVRHEIVPRAMERNPQLLDTLCRCMNIIGDEDDMLDARVRELSPLIVWEDINGDGIIDYEAGCLIKPEFGQVELPLRRRAAFVVLKLILGDESRVAGSAVEAIATAFENGAPISGYTNNIQGNLALSANKHGLRIEPMAVYRTRRKRNNLD